MQGPPYESMPAAGGRGKTEPPRGSPAEYFDYAGAGLSTGPAG